MKKYVLLTILAFSLFSCQSKEEAADNLWIGTTTFFGTSVHLEVELNEDLTGGQVSIFGESVRNYDVAFVQNQEIEKMRNQGDSLSLEFSIQGHSAQMKGFRFGDVFSGQFIFSEQKKDFSLFKRKTNSNAELENYHGLYVFESDTFLITPREYGGLRLINLNQGSSETLLPVQEGHFTTRSTLIEEKEPTVVIRFPKKEEEIIGMLWNEKTERFGEKIDALSQKIIEIDASGITLTGTLLCPKDLEVFDLLVLVHGSGPIYRTALIEAAYRFVEMGYGVFIFDKRGTGGSTGKQTDEYDLLANDAMNVLECMKEQPYVRKIGFQGHSQAGWVIPLAVAKGGNPDFVIIVNGGSVDESTQVLYDKKFDLLKAGVKRKEQNEALSILKRVHLYIRDRLGDQEKLEIDFLKAQKEEWFDLLDLPRFSAIPSWENPPQEMVEYSKKLNYDPIKTQKQIKVPVLVVIGGRDETVPPEEVERGWRQSLNKNLQIVVYPELGHDMRVDSEYGRIFSKPFVNTEKAWLKSILSPKE